MEYELAVAAAGAALSGLVSLVLFSRAFSSGALRRPGGGEAALLWLGLVFAESALFFGAGAAALAGAPEPLSRLLFAFDGTYGLPAFYLFVRESLGAPSPRPARHFLPTLALALAAFVLALLGGAAPEAGAATSEASARLRGFDYLESASWIVETLQVAVYGLLSLRLLLEPRREGPRLLQARRLALALLASYLAFFAWVWLGSGLDYLRALATAAYPVEEGVDLPEYLLSLAFTFVAAFATISRPWLLFGESWGAAEIAGVRPEVDGRPGPREARPSCDASPGPAARPLRAKYARTKLDPEEGGRLVARARARLASLPDLSSESLTPRSLAAELGVAYHVLSRAANEGGAGGLLGLIVEARLDRAERLLAERPELSVLDVAYEAGFAAKSSFNEAFKRRRGLGPREWRESVRGAGRAAGA